MTPTHKAARYMQRGALMVLLTAIVAVLTRPRLAILLAAVAVLALAVWAGMIVCDALGVPCDEDER